MLGLCSKDISTTKRDANGKPLEPDSKYQDWGVFGLGYRPGPSCVASTYRIGGGSSRQTIERLQKICSHEIGHNLGLKHCQWAEDCVMRDAAERISTIDNVSTSLCQHCREQLR